MRIQINPLSLFRLPESRLSSEMLKPSDMQISFPLNNFHLVNWIIISSNSFLSWKCDIHCELFLGSIITFNLSIRKKVVLGKYFDSLTSQGILSDLLATTYSIRATCIINLAQVGGRIGKLSLLPPFFGFEISCSCMICLGNYRLWVGFIWQNVDIYIWVSHPKLPVWGMERNRTDESHPWRTYFFFYLYAKTNDS